MPGEDVFSWSTTAANNSNADTSINWSEGQPRASVNNSARAMMAATAKYRDLTSGKIITAGTANAYTFPSGIGYTVIPVGLRVLLNMNAANTGPSTLNMDGIGATNIVNAKNYLSLVGGELLGGLYGEFRYDGSNWVLLSGADTVSKSGDTMTGRLNITYSGDFGANNNSQLIVGATPGSDPNLLFGSTDSVKIGLNIATNSFVVGGGGFPQNRMVVSKTGNLTVAGDIAFGTSGLFSLNDGATSREIRFHPSFLLAWDVASATLRYWVVGIPRHTWDVNGNYSITGNGFKPGGGDWADSSDARIKNVLGDYSGGLDAINHLRPVRYTFKGNDGEHVADGKEFIGLVAQDVEAIMPEMVTKKAGTIDGKPVTDIRVLDTGALIYALVNAVQQLTSRIEELEAR